jgi:CrcB protein
MLRNIALVGIGGMVGSIARYLVSVLVTARLPIGFPYGTLTVNIVGCFFIGLIMGLAERGTLLSPLLRLVLATGFCGGFTTFSSFSYEVIELLRAHRYEAAVLYVVVSIVIGLSATILGFVITR